MSEEDAECVDEEASLGSDSLQLRRLGQDHGQLRKSPFHLARKVLRNLHEFFQIPIYAVDWEDFESSERESINCFPTDHLTGASGYKLNHSYSTSQPVIMASKIHLYSMATPNGQKIGIALEEMGLEYEPHTINIGKNETYTPDFIKLNPNSKIPVIVDPEGPDGKPITIFESGAILLYLAEKSGKFLSTNPRHKWETIQWLMFQMGGVGPMFGQFVHFYRFAKDKCLDPYPTERYAKESMRLLGVLENRLEGRDFIIDDGYSIADMALFPWIRAAKTSYEEKLEFHRFPLVNAWVDRCFARPATATGTTVCKL